MLMDLPFKVVFYDSQQRRKDERGRWPLFVVPQFLQPDARGDGTSGQFGRAALCRASPNDLNAGILPEDSGPAEQREPHEELQQQRIHAARPPQRIDEAGRIERARTWSAKERFVEARPRGHLRGSPESSSALRPPIFSHRSSGLYDSGLGHSEHRRRSSVGFHVHGKRRSSSRPFTGDLPPARPEGSGPPQEDSAEGLREIRLMLKQNLIKSNICMERVLEMRKERQIDRQLFHIALLKLKSAH
ncbi:hypothetical protein M3Y99_01216300 [Aphelenchoides fujianensis]|nr:hypothetical protein M3Y99_01216300 [Aphelenchoides fujianensis]